MTNIQTALERVPDLERFYGVQEMFDRAREVAQTHPDIASYREVGHSSDGEAIAMVSIGSGNTSIVLFACPHPNEPIGAMLVQFLLEELIANPALREGRTWHLLPCVDPDGTRLNEGWFAGPFTLRNYARHFYRPRSEEQVEWTFPFEYKNFSWKTPIPETQALMTAFGLTQPDFVYSLHNAGFGGVYYYVSKNLPRAFSAFHSIPKDLGLFMALGEPEMPWASEYAPAVYEMPSLRDAYDYFERHASRPPEQTITAGGSSFDYLRSIADPVMLITELPYFQAADVSDHTPIQETRREVILAGLAQSQQIYTVLNDLIDQTSADMTDDSRFLRASATFIRDVPKTFEANAHWAATAEGMDQPATVAQRAAALYVSLFYTVLVASMLNRAFAHQLTVNEARSGIPGSSSANSIRAAKTSLEAHLETWMGLIEKKLPHHSIPIRTLVQVQYGAMLAVLDDLENGTRHGA